MPYRATWWCCLPFTLKIYSCFLYNNDHLKLLEMVKEEELYKHGKDFCFLSLVSSFFFPLLFFSSFLFSFLPGKGNKLRKKSVSLWILIMRAYTLDIDTHVKKESNLRKTVTDVFRILKLFLHNKGKIWLSCFSEMGPTSVLKLLNYTNVHAYPGCTFC